MVVHWNTTTKLDYTPVYMYTKVFTYLNSFFFLLKGGGGSSMNLKYFRQEVRQLIHSLQMFGLDFVSSLAQ